MGLRQRKWAKIARERLFQQFGSVCRVCGGRECLEFDCIKPTGSYHHGMGESWRICYYRRQAALGNLQVLCSRCNSRKGDDDMELVFGTLLASMLTPLPDVNLNPF